MNDFSDMLSKAKKMQDKMKELQDSLKKIEIEGSAGGDLVKVTLGGDYEIKSILLADSKNEKQETINDFSIAAHNDAEKIKKKHQRSLLKLLGFYLPLISNYLFKWIIILKILKN